MISVFISNENIQAVVGTRSGGRVKISQICTGSVGEGSVIGGVITDENQLRDRLVSVWMQNRLPKSGIHLVVESSSVSTKLLTLPNVRNNYLMSLVKENFTEFEAENALYDYAVIGADSSGGVNVLACMTESSFVKSYISLFESAGLKLESVDLAVCGQIRMAQTCMELKNSSYILAVLDKNMVSQFLFIEGEYRFSKRQRMIYDRETPELCEEMSGMISTLLQFKKSENISAEISDVYLCGFSDTEVSSISLMAEGNMRIGGMAALSEVVCADQYKGMLSDCVLALGGLF